jgi:hypothetical protein
VVAAAAVEVGIAEAAEEEAMVLIEIVTIHFILVLIITVLSLMETTTIEVTIIVEAVTRINRAHTRHELLTKPRQ